MKVSSETLNAWENNLRRFSEQMNFQVKDIVTGSTAWLIAYKLDIPREAYKAGLNDAHIETALRRLFPCAVFGVGK